MFAWRGFFAIAIANEQKSHASHSVSLSRVEKRCFAALPLVSARLLSVAWANLPQTNRAGRIKRQTDQAYRTAHAETDSFDRSWLCRGLGLTRLTGAELTGVIRQSMFVIFRAAAAAAVGNM